MTVGRWAAVATDGLLDFANALLEAALGLANHATGPLAPVACQLAQQLIELAADLVDGALRALIVHAPVTVAPSDANR